MSRDKLGGDQQYGRNYLMKRHKREMERSGSLVLEFRGSVAGDVVITLRGYNRLLWKPLVDSALSEVLCREIKDSLIVWRLRTSCAYAYRVIG